MKTPRLILLLTLLFLASVVPARAAQPPNIVIILADDMGWGDLGCYGHPSIKTPHLDQMAGEGMRFTDFYVAACVCTPSRAGLLTGRYPIRFGMAGGKHNVMHPTDHLGLPTNEITIADALKTQGYATACIGKWHLGQEPPYMPRQHGFDYFYGLRWSNDMEPKKGIPKNASSSLHPKLEWWEPALLRNEDFIEKPTDLSTLTQRYTREAQQFIRENKKKPFFLYLAHNYPHVPLFASKAFQEKSSRGLYGDVVEELDWSVGQVLDTLQKEGLAKNTLVFFTSDNGPWLIKELAGGSAGPFRDGKGSTWEGGSREPAIAWWPGKIKPHIVNHNIVSSMDLFATAAHLAGAALPTDRVMDSLDLTPMLLGQGPDQRETIFYYHNLEVFAVRKGPYKMHIITQTGYSSDPPVKHDPPLLFQIENDPGESVNVAAQHPEIVADLRHEIDLHEKSITPVPPRY